MLHQRSIRRVETLAGAKIAKQVKGGCAERIMPGITGRSDLIGRYTETLVFCAMTLDFSPVAGCQQNAIAVIDVAARNGSREQIQARITFGSLDTVVRKDKGVPGKQFLMLPDLEVSCPGEQSK